MCGANGAAGGGQPAARAHLLALLHLQHVHTDMMPCAAVQLAAPHAASSPTCGLSHCRRALHAAGSALLVLTSRGPWPCHAATTLAGIPATQSDAAARHMQLYNIGAAAGWPGMWNLGLSLATSVKVLGWLPLPTSWKGQQVASLAWQVHQWCGYGAVFWLSVHGEPAGYGQHVFSCHQRRPCRRM